MAAAKTNTMKKETTIAANHTSKTDIKKAETKTTVPVKEEIKTAAKPQAAEKKEPVKKAPAKKTAAKKTTKKRGPKPASERTIDLHVQFGGKEVSYTELVNRVKEMWKEQGKRETSLKSLSIYVKPEEFKAYYVINDKITGEMDF